MTGPHGYWEPWFVFQVGPEHIDHEKWARLGVYAVNHRPGSTSPVYWIASALGFVLLLLLSPIAAAIVVAMFAVLALGRFLLLRQNRFKVARYLREQPTALDPFSFQVDSAGTHLRSVRESEDATWARYDYAVEVEDCIAIVGTNRSARIIPIAAYSSGSPIETIVPTIQHWINHARTQPPGPSTAGRR